MTSACDSLTAVMDTALTCRSEGGPTEEELKEMYMTCLKKQEGENSNETTYPDEQDWKDSRRRFNPRHHGSRDEEREERTRNRGDREDKEEREDRMRNRGDREDKEEREDRTRNRGDRTRGRDNTMDRTDNDRQKGNRNDRNNRDKNRMDGRDERNGKDNGYENKHRVIGRNEDFGDDPFDDFYNSFPKNYEFDISRYNVLHSTTQSSRRFKRSKRTQMNSGQRSQYNPNTKKPSEYDDNTSNEDDKNSSSNTDVDNQACALHCFLESLEMTDDEGMPDKYLVTQVITKDVQNEDLMDFLQEAIEECFQLLENEKPEDKCEYSKMLMTCLSEKGKANCDDWKEDMKF
ncbi:unnamed protein product [Chilo suppressalis]|uniref:Uncharacterized protein n=1 Tax=Chilo suppressalis TaxID=168631 RepID=A0ABN8ARF1_CHISP|nr:unnamed protein product [Chilo suppressalis]